MVVTTVTFHRAGGVSRFAAEFCQAASPERIFAAQIVFHAEVEPPETPGDPFLAAALLPAMFLGESLEIRAPVSGRLVKAVATVQDIFLSWYPAILKRIEVVTPFVVPDGTARCSDATACFFSGGMDSRYSLVKHRHTISALLTVKGFDIPSSDETVWPQLVAANRETAAAFGMKLIPVETNLRDALDPTYPGLGRAFDGDFWGQCLHGPFLAAVGLCLQRHFGTVIIPSTWPYQRLQPWGSHPLVDQQWTTAATTFMHDGCELGRLGKLKVVAKTPGALRHLRTCSVYTSGCYNCGNCDKCYRTNLMLQLFGVFEQAGSYGEPVPLHSLITWQMPPPLRASLSRSDGGGVSPRPRGNGQSPPDNRGRPNLLAPRVAPVETKLCTTRRAGTEKAGISASRPQPPQTLEPPAQRNHLKPASRTPRPLSDSGPNARSLWEMGGKAVRPPG